MSNKEIGQLKRGRINCAEKQDIMIASSDPRKRRGERIKIMKHYGNLVFNAVGMAALATFLAGVVVGAKHAYDAMDKPYL